MTDIRTYHADNSRWGASMLRVALKSLRLAEAYYVTKTTTPPESTEAQVIGDAIHAACLEPVRYAEMFRAVPADVLAKDGSRRGGKWTEFKEQEASEGKQLLMPSDVEIVTAAAEAATKLLRPLLDREHFIERTIEWEDAATRLPCKCRPDLLYQIAPDRWLVVDLKTCTDATFGGFRRDAQRYQYWLQATHYCSGVESTLGGSADFWWLAVQKESPYFARWYALDDNTASVAAVEYSRLIDRVANATRTGVWADPGEEGPARLKLWIGGNDDGGE